jgi:hypothetical protein
VVVEGREENVWVFVVEFAETVELIVLPVAFVG